MHSSCDKFRKVLFRHRIARHLCRVKQFLFFPCCEFSAHRQFFYGSKQFFGLHICLEATAVILRLHMRLIAAARTLRLLNFFLTVQIGQQ